jgi:DNA ligase-1
MLYKELVDLYELLDSTTKRLQKTVYLSELIKKTGSEELSYIIALAQGKVFPDWEDKKIGVATRIVIKSINKSTGISEKEIENEWKREGDLGSVAEKLIKKRKQSSLFPRKLGVREVYDNLRSLADAEGKGSVESKINIISDMLIGSESREAKYITRTVLDNLRIGIGAGSIRDAIVWAFFSDRIGIHINEDKIEISDREAYNKIISQVQKAYDLTNDFGEVAKQLSSGGLESLRTVKLRIGTPLKVMLFQKAKDIADAFSIVGKPAAFEYKYDGFRMQVHKNKEHIVIYTRRLEDVTEQFPEVSEYVGKYVKADTCILDAEAVGFDPKTKKYVAFQNISQRIKRKYDIKEVAEKFPVELNVFDIMYYDNKNLLAEPFRKRREILNDIIVQKDKCIVLAKQIITSNENKAMEFYESSLDAGEEGMMAKNLEGIYQPGARVGYGVKIKSIMEPLDLVIVAAEYGEGKRSGWLTSYTMACSDKGDLKDIGKTSTGLKEKESEGTTFKEITELLKPLIIKSSGKSVKVKPKIVIEVGYEEIQKSQSYSSGYALRFPRFKRLRTDEKTVDDINTLTDVERLYRQQRGRSE